MHKLKWLNGPLAGLEFDLPAGATQIGGDDADVALPLEGDARAVLTSGEDGVRVSADAGVWVDGGPWDAGDALPFDRAIDVAGVAFVLGGSGDALPARPVPERRRAARRSTREIACWSGAALSIAAIVAGLALLLWRPPQPARFDVDAWLAQQLRAPALRGLHAQRAADGSVVVSGLCASSQDVGRLRARLGEHGVAMRDESFCADALRENVRNVLALNGYRDVDIRSDATLDSVEIRGPIVADAAWQRVVAQLQMLRGLRAWRVVNDRALWFDRLCGTLTGRVPLDGLNIVMSGKTLIVSGAADPAHAPALADAIAEFNRSSRDGFVATWQDVPSLQTASAYLPAPVVTVGGHAGAIYVVLANGMRLQLGGVLPNGYAIVRLTRRAMSLRKDQRLVSVPLDV
ncbi:type III secretion system inner membrane ring subunit SctD [Burkholderia oklahomensis]|uniref:type III secretion system inner membrane ring subunit SctD n=1 Tax=Burkholderia oklahomensis TaxID=342113 RepID=UPI00016A9816|nr:type III secretion system inner membrane ring subunit SctD [Burkholderia oklahomensis]AJX33958.1 type III secretion apparatus protein, YscD/HrpQ family [Burkholderia oklahomensis C6786]AOI48890.1 type III secretion protein [Burkholderia oklahomensis C6786]KUY50508.1 type III secretion protein [Burkholderia oklahomensis C6786]MBI0362904.1 type III secretion system inner membrane ring subunit SctD [Burkholderia oklahomensis]SUY27007.1 type III secretion system protein SsaD [Burkholderia oklah